MNKLSVFSVLSIGIFSTAFMDFINLWMSKTDLIMKLSLNFLGRVGSEWLNGNFIVNNAIKIGPVSNEYFIGIAVHYSIGIFFALFYMMMTKIVFKKVKLGKLPLMFGLSTSIISLFMLFPSLGLGVLGSKGPINLLYSSIFNHLMFGVGLWIGIWAVARLSTFANQSGISEPVQDGDTNSRDIPGSYFLSLSAAQAISAATLGVTFMTASMALVDISDGNKVWSGVPIALILIASAIMSYPIAKYKDNHGYKKLLIIAFTLGSLGALSLAFGLINENIPMIVISCLMVGASTGSILLSRFAAAEVASLEHRGRAISIVMTGATLGAIGGPLLISSMSTFSALLDLGNSLAIIAIAMLNVIGFFLLNALGITKAGKNKKAQVDNSSIEKQSDLSSSKYRNKYIYSIGSLLGAQAAMVLLMSVTPSEMHSHHHSVDNISAVLALHFLGMYGTSFISGWLADRYGRYTVISLGSLILTISMIIGYGSADLVAIYSSLFLLGMGWNFCFISASALLADNLKSSGKGHMQGINDMLMNLTSALSSIGAGLVLSGYGSSTLAIIGAFFAVIPIALYIIIFSIKSKDMKFFTNKLEVK